MATRRKRAIRPLAASRLTKKGQATLPAAIRKSLNLRPGDTVIFEESGRGRVLLRRAEPLDVEFLSALESTLSEWNSEMDDEAYGDL
jgi:AbrB family looped-hinge helix DNA binding protein